jgi:uncharacterized protein (DUF2164 family)
MTNIKRSWDILSDDERGKAINELIAFFSMERNEKIGIIAAGYILDIFLQTTGVTLYNKGIDAANNYTKKRFEELNADIEISVKK